MKRPSLVLAAAVFVVQSASIGFARADDATAPVGAAAGPATSGGSADYILKLKKGKKPASDAGASSAATSSDSTPSTSKVDDSPKSETTPVPAVTESPAATETKPVETRDAQAPTTTSAPTASASVATTAPAKPDVKVVKKRKPAPTVAQGDPLLVDPYASNRPPVGDRFATMQPNYPPAPTYDRNGYVSGYIAPPLPIGPTGALRPVPPRPVSPRVEAYVQPDGSVIEVDRPSSGGLFGFLSPRPVLRDYGPARVPVRESASNCHFHAYPSDARPFHSQVRCHWHSDISDPALRYVR